jgi:hypothetical protein
MTLDLLICMALRSIAVVQSGLMVTRGYNPLPRSASKV